MQKLILSIWYAITRGIGGLIAALFIIFLMAAGSDTPTSEMARSVTFLLLGLPALGIVAGFIKGMKS
jgi:hypothetical protein